MPLIFANASALWLLPAASLPVIFHLFFRLRKQLHDFPTLMFFLRIDPRLSAKRKIHEWLILLLRTLLILAIIFALARPSTGLVNQSSGVAHVLIIDNSGSMAQSTQPGVTKLRLACQSAESFFTSKHPGDSAAIQLMIPDPTSTLPSGFEANVQTLRDQLEKVEATDAAPSIPRAIRLALATLKNAKQSAYEIHIITDLQDKNWSQGQLGSLNGTAHWLIHRIETAPINGGAVSLEIADAPTRSIPVGRITPIRFLLANRSKEKAQVRLNAADDTGKNITQDISINGDETVPATLTFTFTNPGFHWAHAWVEGDVCASATHATVGFWSTDVAQALFVGERQEFGALPFAVAPGGSPDLSGIQPTFVGPDKLTEMLSAPTPPLAVVITWSNWPETPLLKSYVEHGGTLFVVPSPKPVVGATSFPPGWFEAEIGPFAQVPSSGESMITLHPDDPLWRDLRDNQGQPKFGPLLAFRENPLKVGSNWVPLLASAHGSNLLARRPLGKGQLFASGIAFTPGWSSLPFKGGFVVLVQNMFFGRTQEQIPVTLSTAGDDVTFDNAGAQTTIRALTGSPLSWQGLPNEFAGFPRSGVYEIVQGPKTKWIATQGNSDETVPDFLPLGPIPLIQTLNPDVLSLKNPDDILVDPQTRASGTPLFGYAIVLALLLLFLETWIANAGIAWLGSSKSSKASKPSKTATKNARA